MEFIIIDSNWKWNDISSDEELEKEEKLTDKYVETALDNI